jgi:hypothetical protein
MEGWAFIPDKDRDAGSRAVPLACRLGRFGESPKLADSQ